MLLSRKAIKYWKVLTVFEALWVTHFHYNIVKKMLKPHFQMIFCSFRKNWLVFISSISRCDLSSTANDIFKGQKNLFIQKDFMLNFAEQISYPRVIDDCQIISQSQRSLVLKELLGTYAFIEGAWGRTFINCVLAVSH